MADIDKLKQAVIDLARQQVGCHYLWGGAGNTPGNSDGAAYRPSHVRLHPNLPDFSKPVKPGGFTGVPYVPTLFAAWVDSSDKGKLACGGRCALPEVQQAAKALDMSDHDALQVKLKTMTQDQLDELKGNLPKGDELRWPRPNGSLSANGKNSTLWGECCLDIRHFDCIGLVNYCFTAILKEPWTYGIGNFTIPANAKANGFLEVSPISKAESCDIVTVGSEHIGIVTNLDSVIEASDTSVGVIERPTTAGHWTQCWRLPKSTWK
jgi:hypothetical protein